MKYRHKAMLERIEKTQPILESVLIAEGPASIATMRWLLHEQYIRRVGHPNVVDRRARAPAAAYIVAPRGQNFLDAGKPDVAPTPITQAEFAALAEAGLMPLDEYIRQFGDTSPIQKAEHLYDQMADALRDFGIDPPEF